jgi:hypothetical protein
MDFSATRSDPVALTNGDFPGGGSPEIHQAAGMVTVQLGVTIVEAEARLRTYAAEAGRSLTDVARDIVARTLSLRATDPE